MKTRETQSRRSVQRMVSLLEKCVDTHADLTKTYRKMEWHSMADETAAKTKDFRKRLRQARKQANAELSDRRPATRDELCTCWECNGDGIDPANGYTCWLCKGMGETRKP